MKDVIKILNDYNSINLKALDKVSLLNRVDKKYVVNVQILPDLLNDLSVDFKVLEIDGKRFFGYSTVYYDTPDNLMYVNHLRGKLNRYKVRHRVYLDSGLSFLEVKFKNNKYRTVKWRTQNAFECEKSGKLNNEFLNQHIPYDPLSLIPSLKNEFNRITLVDNELTHRLTIDLKIGFNGEGNYTKNIPQLAVIETKTEKSTENKTINALFRKYNIKPVGFSKYCVGRSLVSGFHPKNGNMKRKLMNLNKIANDSLNLN